MIHIKERLKQYADKYSDCYKYAGVYVKVIQDMIEQLLADLEQDEKENGWIPVSERLPETDDYIIPAEDIEKLNTMLKDFPAEYGYLLSGAALSACPKNTVIADMVIENILHRKSYRKISKERYIPMNPKDFYGYRRKTVAVLYERMRLLGVWEE